MKMNKYHKSRKIFYKTLLLGSSNLNNLPNLCRNNLEMPISGSHNYKLNH